MAKKLKKEVLAWGPLRLEMRLANKTEDIDRNIEATLSSKYQHFHPYINRERGAVSIVGSGPSLKQTYRKIRGDIIACNAAGQFLLEKGITPKYWMCFDADPLIETVLSPHKDVTYLLASRCTRGSFEMLKDCNVVVWHAAGDLNIQALLEKHQKIGAMVGGGSAAVTRSLFLAYAMGYREAHLYGCDSSYESMTEPTHFRESTTEEKRIAIGVSETNEKDSPMRTYNSTPWMAQQTEDFKILIPQLQGIGMKINVHGSGLIPHVAKLMRVNVDDEPKWKHVWRDAHSKARFLWQHL